jgi:hypothetical protein
MKPSTDAASITLITKLSRESEKRITQSDSAYSEPDLQVDCFPVVLVVHGRIYSRQAISQWVQ